jgi:BMFP domain-containing protein YqiC
MLKEKVFEDLSARLSELVANSPARDVEKNARALLSGFFTRLDLVTRQEFDVQSELLRRTREKLEQLEAKVAVLENPKVPEPENPNVGEPEDQAASRPDG